MMMTSLNTVRQGQGETVILLHSGGMSSRQWRKLIEQLAPSYAVVAPDFLGAGANPVWEESIPFHFKLDIESIVSLVEGPSHLVGHSYGGFLAIQIARLYPGRVRSLTVYDPVAFGILYDTQDEAGLSNLENATAHPLFSDWDRGGSEDWLELFIDYWSGPGAWKSLPAPSRESFLKAGRKVFLEVMSLGTDRTTLAEFQEIKAPTLFLYGEKSPASARRVCQILGAEMPNARSHEVAGAGHMGPITHGPAVNALIEEHLKGI